MKIFLTDSELVFKKLCLLSRTESMIEAINDLASYSRRLTFAGGFERNSIADKRYSLACSGYELVNAMK